MSEKDIELLCRLIGTLLFMNKVTISDVQLCVTYILTRIELSTKLSQQQTLEYRYIVCEEDMNVCIVIYRRPKQPFRDIVLWT